MALSSKSVTVFAALEALRDNQTDIRYALATLFEPDLAKFNGEGFSPAKLSAEINRQYHLSITTDVIEGFSEIFHARGWLEKLVDGGNVAYTVQCPPVSQVPAELEKFQNAASQIADQFRKFIVEISPLSQVSKSDSELVDELVDWLMLLDRAGDQTIKQASTTYRVGNKIVLDVEDQEDGGSPSESTFLCARFVEHLFETNSKFIAFLIELSEVGLITEVVRDFQRPSTQTKASSLCIYLDAPLAMDFLGLSGKPQQVTMEMLINGLRKIGGSVRIFRESVNEIQSNLLGVLNRPIHARTGPTADALRRKEVLEAYVRDVAAQPDTYLTEQNIGVLDETLEMYPNQHKFFDRYAYEELYSQNGWVKDDAAKHHDAVIAALTFRKRSGVRTSDLFSAKHVVITRNPSYSRLARRVALEKHYISPSHVGPVIHQRQLATALWLRIGAGNDEQIPRSYILAACRRVLTLRKNIVERIDQFKDSLSEDQAVQLEVLMASDRSARVLMDKTLGSANVIDAGNMPLLLDEMKKAQIAEFEAQKDEEFEKLRLDAQAINTLHSERISKATEEVVAAKQEAEMRRETLDNVTARVVLKVNKRIVRLRTMVALLLVFAFALVTSLAFFWKSEDTLLTGFVFLIILIVGSIVQFFEPFRKVLLDRWFHKRTMVIFDRTCIEFGLVTDDVLKSVMFDGHVFVQKIID